MLQSETKSSFILPAQLLKLLPARAVLMCAVINSYKDRTGTAQLSNDFMGGLLGVKPSTVATLLNQLVKNGHVVIKKEPVTGNRLLLLSCAQNNFELSDELISGIEDRFCGL